MTTLEELKTNMAKLYVLMEGINPSEDTATKINSFLQTLNDHPDEMTSDLINYVSAAKIWAATAAMDAWINGAKAKPAEVILLESAPKNKMEADAVKAAERANELLRFFTDTNFLNSLSYGFGTQEDRSIKQELMNYPGKATLERLNDDLSRARARVKKGNIGNNRC